MHADFDLPSRGRVDGRTSSITAAFFQAITPVIPPSNAEVEEALGVLGMASGSCHCAYCGDPRTEWDHFRPIVKGRQHHGDRQPRACLREVQPVKRQQELERVDAQRSGPFAKAEGRRGP